MVNSLKNTAWVQMSLHNIFYWGKYPIFLVNQLQKIKWSE
jgi:hypothetical protein